MDGLNHCFQYCNSFNMTVKVTHIEVHDNKLSVLQILKAEQIVELSKPMILRRYSAYKSAELKVCYYRLKFMYPLETMNQAFRLTHIVTFLLKYSMHIKSITSQNVIYISQTI